MADFQEKFHSICSWYQTFSKEEKDSLLKELYLMSDKTDAVNGGHTVILDRKIDIFAELSADIVLVILENLPVESILVCRIVSTEWERKISNCRIWFDLCTRAHFKVPQGLTPIQYMKTFLYLRDRTLNIRDHVEVVELNRAPKNCVRNVKPTALEYKCGKLVYCMGTIHEPDPVNFLCLMKGQDCSVIFRKQIDYRTDIVTLSENYIVGASLKLEEMGPINDAYTIHAYSTLDGQPLYKTTVEVDHMVEVGLLDCSEELDITLLVSDSGTQILRLSSGDKLHKLDTSYLRAECVMICKVLLAIPKICNAQHYFVFSSIYNYGVIASVLDRQTHEVIHHEMIYTIGADDIKDGLEIATYETDGDIYLRILVPKDGDRLDTIRLSILTHRMPSFAEGAMQPLGNTLLHSDVLYHIENKLPVGSYPSIKRAINFKHSRIIGTGGAYHLIMKGNFADPLGIYCADYGRGNNPLAERDGPVENGSLVQVSLERAPQLVPTTSRHELSTIDFPGNIETCQTYTFGELEWLNGFGDELGKQPLVVLFGHRANRIVVLRFKETTFKL